MNVKFILYLAGGLGFAEELLHATVEGLMSRRHAGFRYQAGSIQEGYTIQGVCTDYIIKDTKGYVLDLP